MKSKESSLTRRLVTAISGAFFLVMVVSYLVLYGVVEKRLRQSRRLLVKERIEAVSALLKSPAHGLEDLTRRVETEWPLRSGERVYIRVSDKHGNLITESPDIPRSLELGGLGIAECEPKQVANSTIESELGSQKFDIYCQHLETSLGLIGPIEIRVAIGDDQSVEYLLHLREVILVILLFSVAAGILIGWPLVKKEMRPLSVIADAISSIDFNDVNTHIDTEGLPIELKRLATAFNLTFRRLAESYERLSRFSSDIAHEIRTPVTNMVGAIEVALGKPRDPAEYEEVLSSAMEECSRIARITESLLFLARAERAFEKLPLSKISLRKDLEALIEFYEPLASEKGLTLALKGISSIPEELSVERILFQRALGNLVSNAINYTPEGGHIDVTAETAGDFIKISVKDSGIGVAAEHLPLIFDRFYRVDPSRTLHSGGAGLGLAIVKSIMELHGGHVEASSDKGQGTTVSTYWPRQKSARRPVRHLSLAPKA